MTTDLINTVFPAMIRFGSRPGSILLAMAAITDGLYLLLSFLAARSAESFFAWFLFAIAVGLAVFIAVFAWRRARLTRHVDDMEAALAAQHLSAGVVAMPVASADRLTDELGLLQEVQWENSIRTARYLPRVEAAQRALVLAAGGTVNAPYLKDDLRVTLVALLGTIAAIPAATLGVMMSVVILAVT